MGDWKDYTIYAYGEEVGQETARSKKEACELYVEKCIERYKEDFGSEPTDDMIKAADENTEAVDLSDDTYLYD